MIGSLSKRGLWLWSLVFVAGGLVLLLDNYFLIDLDWHPYWPLLIVVAGIQLLLRGDIGLNWQAHTFGITRGSVLAASIEVESGELDVQLRALRKPGRLVAGQYTARSRPSLSVRNNRASLILRRGQTWWLSLADWDVGLATDLPWGILVSSYLGHLDVDLRGLNVDRAYVASGLGSITLTCPEQASGPIFARSTFGDIHVTIPELSHAVITVKNGPFSRVQLDPARFEQLEPGIYSTAPAGDESHMMYISASTVFGSVHIS